MPVAIALLLLLIGTVTAPWIRPPVPQQPAIDPLAHYVGESVCLACHGGDSPGLQSAGYPFGCALRPIAGHREAYWALESEAAKAIALLSGEPAVPTSSRVCTACHSAAADEGPRWTLNTFNATDGVQCESCHGPGSRHVQSASTTLKAGWDRAAIVRLGEAIDCAVCHRSRPSHVEVLEKGFRPGPADSLYKTPVGLAISPDGGRLYVVCQQSNSLVEIDTRTFSVLRETKVGIRPHAAAIGPDGRRVYVTNRLSGTMTVIDSATMSVVAEAAVGHEPHKVAVVPDSGAILIANTGDNSLAYVDPQSLAVTKRLLMGGSPWGIAIAHDSNRAYVTNVRPRLGRFREPSVSEVAVIDLNTNAVTARPDVPEANMLQGIAHVKAEGVTLFTLMRTKNLIPTTRTTQGWVVTNGLGLLWPDGRVDQVLLDEPSDGFADAFDVAIAPDQRRAVVVAAGTDEIAIVDLQSLIEIVSNASPSARTDALPNTLGGIEKAIVGRVRVGRNPRATVFASDGKVSYVANALDDTVSVVDIKQRTIVATIDLGGPKEISEIRRGEILFHSADSSTGRQFSCRSCHPDGHHNGLTFDIEADGLGLHPSDNRTLQGIFDTPPFKWEGTNPSLHRQCGPRFSVFFTRLTPLQQEDLDALVRYMSTIERPPNRYREVSGLTVSQRRGKEIFERRARNDGTRLAPEQRCVHCHSGAYRTNGFRSEVATTMWFDAAVDVDLSREIENTNSFGELGSYYFVDVGIRPKVLDNPHLTNIADGAPYLHNGAANSLEEIWTRFNMTDRHGTTADLTRAQLNDLIAYLKAQ